MSDLDFEELDKAINELYESLDEDDSELMESANDEQQNDAVRSVAHEDVARKGEATKHTRRAGRANTGAVARVPADESVDDDIEVAKTAQQAADDVAEPVKLNSKGPGHFMDMVHPSSDAQVQHKHNFAPERQAELDAKLAEEAAAEASEEKATELSKITVAVVDEVDEEPAKQPKSIAIAHDEQQSDDRDKKSVKVESDADEAQDQMVQSDVEDSKSDGATDAGETTENTPRHKPSVAHMAGRRGTQYVNTNRRTSHDLAQPLPVATAAAAASAEEAAAKPAYETPFLPDAKVEKRPLGGGKTVKSPVADYVSATTDSNRTRDDHEDAEEPQPHHHASPSHVENVGRNSGASIKTRPGATNRTESDRTRLSVGSSSRRRSGAYTGEQSSSLSVASGRDKAMRIIGRVLLFLFIVIAGVLTGLAFYYYGG